MQSLQCNPLLGRFASAEVRKLLSELQMPELGEFHCRQVQKQHNQLYGSRRKPQIARKILHQAQIESSAWCEATLRLPSRSHRSTTGWPSQLRLLIKTALSGSALPLFPPESINVRTNGGQNGFLTWQTFHFAAAVTPPHQFCVFFCFQWARATMNRNSFRQMDYNVPRH